MRYKRIIGRAARRAAAFQQRRMKPAAMLVRAFKIDIGWPFQIAPLLEHEDMRGRGVEPHVQDIAHLLPLGGLLDDAFEEALACVLIKPRIDTLSGEGVHDALDKLLGFLEIRIRDDLARFLMHENGNRHAPHALARDDVIRPRLDHAAETVAALRRDKLRVADSLQRQLADGVLALHALNGDGLIDGDEPLRRVAVDDRRFRPPGMRIVMLVARVHRNERVCFLQRLNNGRVGVSHIVELAE